MDKNVALFDSHFLARSSFPTFLNQRLPKTKASHSKRTTHINRACLCEDQVSSPQTLTKLKHKAGVERGGAGCQGQKRNNHKGSRTSKSPQRLNRSRTTSGKPSADTALGNFGCSVHQALAKQANAQPPFAPCMPTLRVYEASLLARWRQTKLIAGRGVKGACMCPANLPRRPEGSSGNRRRGGQTQEGRPVASLPRPKPGPRLGQEDLEGPRPHFPRGSGTSPPGRAGKQRGRPGAAAVRSPRLPSRRGPSGSGQRGSRGPRAPRAATAGPALTAEDASAEGRSGAVRPRGAASPERGPEPG